MFPFVASSQIVIFASAIVATLSVTPLAWLRTTCLLPVCFILPGPSPAPLAHPSTAVSARAQFVPPIVASTPCDLAAPDPADSSPGTSRPASSTRSPRPHPRPPRSAPTDAAWTSTSRRTTRREDAAAERGRVCVGRGAGMRGCGERGAGVRNVCAMWCGAVRCGVRGGVWNGWSAGLW